ncbi:alpha/beta hydrolase family protein [Nocardia sp. NPDC057663]|uniref:alpha/beta hydrolase family protein n=1 Tax=Nocardia sp. NPDC057663 TaxID=3346201 RepID=UPI00366DA2D6
MLLRITLLATMFAALLSGAPLARANDLTTTDITFTRSDGTTTTGTVHAPAGATGRPGVVLVHGSGTRRSPHYAQVAEALARQGIVALHYEKRTEDYTPAHRDFSLLADDALAGVAALRNRPEVNPAQVGLWGLSEGGWIAPLATSRSADVAFLITIGANSGAPAAQQTWANETRFAAAGIRGSMIDVLARNGIRQIAGAGQFAQAGYDPLPVLARIEQPVLAIWGDKDRLTPPGDSLRGFQEAFDRAGKTNYTLRTLPNAQHGGFTTTDGFDKGEQLAPGYAQLMGNWVNGLPGSAVGQADEPAVQGHSVSPLTPLAWWESTAAQLALLAGTLLALAGYALTGLARAWRLPDARSARILTAAAGIGIVGTVAQVFFVASTRATSFGPLLFGRTLSWVALQLVAVCAVVALGFVIARRGRMLDGAGTGARIRWALVVCGGIGFTLWAFYWGLLLP